MDRYLKHKKFVGQVCRVKDPDKLKQLIRHASKGQVKALVDVTLNVMKKNLPASKKAVAFIKANRRNIRHLLHPKFSVASKKRYLIQKGGGIFAPLLAMFRTVGGRMLTSTAGRLVTG